jgi:alkylation response protein AidB-like acyl-CoA dehydrogenase
MDIDLSSEQILFRDATRKYLSAEMPVSRVRELSESKTGYERDWWQRGTGLGWTAMLVPPDLGGGTISDSGLSDLMIVAEEVGRHVAPGPPQHDQRARSRDAA